MQFNFSGVTLRQIALKLFCLSSPLHPTRWPCAEHSHPVAEADASWAAKRPVRPVATPWLQVIHWETKLNLSQRLSLSRLYIALRAIEAAKARKHCMINDIQSVSSCLVLLTSLQIISASSSSNFSRNDCWTWLSKASAWDWPPKPPMSFIMSLKSSQSSR